MPPPAAEPTWTSPEAVFTSDRPPTAPSWTSPLAERTLASRSTSSAWTSPDAVFTSTAPSRPARGTSAEAMFASTSDPCGVRMRMSNSSPLQPNRFRVPRSRCRGRAARPSGRRGRRGSPRRRRSSSATSAVSTSMRPAPIPKRSFGGSGVANSYLTAIRLLREVRRRGWAGGRRGRCDGRRLPLGEMSERSGYELHRLLLSALAVAGQAAADRGRRRRSRRRDRGPAP